MPYIVITAHYPSHLARKSGERFIEVSQKNPPDESLGKQVVPIAAKATKEGIKVLSITEVAKGKFEEAFKRTGELLANYHDIEGHEVSVDVYMTLEEGLASLGMSLPG